MNINEKLDTLEVLIDDLISKQGGNEADLISKSVTNIKSPAPLVGSYAFYGCSKLNTADLPLCSQVQGSAFTNCESLTTLQLSNCTYIGSSAFYRCYNLKSLYLLTSSTKVPTLNGTSTFSYTPIGGYSTSAKQYGTVYVRESMVSAFKNATNWTYYASRIVGLTDEQIAALDN